VPDRDLMICHPAGIAWQADMTVTAEYDAGYFNKCLSYEDKAIALAINRGRIDLVNTYVGNEPVLDIGIGSGEFIKKRPGTFGTDINPTAIEWLKRRGLYSERFDGFAGFTLWDVIEHMPEPDALFRKIPPGAYVFTSIPIFDDLNEIRQSRHYRPGEHLLYFTEPGFIHFMAWQGFSFLEERDFETQAGRDSILSFAFRKVSGWMN
jgi:hypothetical protein